MLLPGHVASPPDQRLPSNRSAVSPNSTCSDWAAWIPPSSAPAIVMQVVSKDYIDVERSFIRSMESNSAFTRQDLYLMCADEESLHYFESTMGIRCISLAGHNVRSHADIWTLRVRVLSCLVEWGQDVIMSDVDALWLADPMNDFAAPPLANSSIVASRGSFPKYLGGLWGSTICMGFVLFRTTGNGVMMRDFLAEMRQMVAEDGDDQVAVNRAALRLGIEWDKEGSDMRYEDSQGYGFGTIDSLTDDEGRSFTVTLLPHDKYTRLCLVTPLSEITVVAHCLSQKRAGAKIDWMRDAGLWPDDEEDIGH
eukprot:g16688.t1